MCMDNQKITATGKNGKPTRAFQISVDFNRRIMSSTKGAKGSWNDKTLAKRDTFLNDLLHNNIGHDVEWTTFNEVGETLRHVGNLHAICDGGYPPYGSLVCAKAGTSDIDAIAWNSRLGQIRKDVECSFGSLKKRFRIFKNGWKSPSLDMLDDAWFTCCALHNLLLGFDENRDEPGDNDDEDSEDDEDSADSEDDEDSEDSEDDEESEDSDESAGDNNSAHEDIADEDSDDENEVRVVASYRESLEARRRILIDHFTELRARDQILWISCKRRAHF